MPADPDIPEAQEEAKLGEGTRLADPSPFISYVNPRAAGMVVQTLAYVCYTEYNITSGGFA